MAVSPGKQYLRLFDALVSNRSEHTAFWQEIAENVFPFRATFNNTSPLVKPNYRKVYDGTPMWSMGMLSAALHSFLTNPALLWAGVAPDDEKLERDYDCMNWTQYVDRFLFSMFLRSTFYSQAHECYGDVSTFGNMAMWMDPDPITVMRYTSIHLSDILWDEGEQGKVDLAIRIMNMTPRQIFGAFPRENLPKRVLDMENKADQFYTEKLRVLHVVRPRGDAGPIPKWHKLGRPIESVYILADNDEGLILDEGGYYEFPVAICRWSCRPGERVGYGPGGLALPNARQLHMLQKHTLRMAQRATDPPLMLPNRAFMGPLDLSAGGLNYYNKSGMAALKGSASMVQPFPQGQQFTISRDEKNDMRELVQRDFFVDRLRVREADRMSAAEVHQRAQENNRVFSPFLGRAHQEWLEPLVQRSFMEALRRKLIPEPPAKMMQRGGLRVKINSPLVKQQGISDVQALVSAVDVLTPFANAKPEILDAINESKLAQFVFKSFGAPLDVIHNPEEYMKALQAQKQQEAEQQGMLASAEGASNMAGAIKDIAGATRDMGGINRMQGLMPGMM